MDIGDSHRLVIEQKKPDTKEHTLYGTMGVKFTNRY